MAGQLPTFEEIRRVAYRMLGNVQDELKSSWRPGHGPTPEQRVALREAREAIAAAKDALNRAAQ